VSVATVEQLTALATGLEVELPNDPQALLDRAQGQVETLGCRTRFTADDLEAMSDDQTAALVAATITQACWLAELGEDWLGPPEVTHAGDVTLTADLPRLAPPVLETLAHTGLIMRSGTALPDPAPVSSDLPWWLWA
jgi:hypothetical protein